MAEQEQIFEVGPQNFQTEVVDRSSRQPVLLLFWAAQVPEAAQAQQQLAALIPRYSGKVALGLVDVAVDQSLAQHLRVQGLPSVRVVNEGQIVGQLDGPQAETAYIDLLDGLTMSSAEVIAQQLGDLLAAGELDQARTLLQQAIEEEPNNPALRIELADVLLRQAAAGQAAALADARTVLDSIPADAPGRERPVERLAFLEELGELPDRATLEAALASDATALLPRFQLAQRLAGEGAYEEALGLALEILKTDREFREDGARLLMLRIFLLLGKGSELAGQYRRQMFNYLH